MSSRDGSIEVSSSRVLLRSELGRMRKTTGLLPFLRLAWPAGPPDPMVVR